MKSSGWSPNHVTFVGVLTAFDLLARAGHLDEAVKLINEMKLEPDVVVWKTLLYVSPSKHLFPVGLVRHIKQRIEIASLLDRCVTSGNKLASGISAAFRICCATLQSTISSFVGLVHHIKQQSKLGSIKRLFAPLVSPYNPPVLPFGEFILLSPIE
uniref:Pentatricopeptide repeat-containing protein n=1 Tax=Brassica oleracea TaxID=3712 RepID=A0A3P6H0M6_BRAOL|nr:unnamed protein product [Brassica oleracea]